jgi:hypothetical protein
MPVEPSLAAGAAVPVVAPPLSAALLSLQSKQCNAALSERSARTPARTQTYHGRVPRGERVNAQATSRPTRAEH